MKLRKDGGEGGEREINNTDGWLDNRVRHASAVRQSRGCPHNFHTGGETGKNKGLG